MTVMKILLLPCMVHVVQAVLFWLLQRKVKGSGDTQISLDAPVEVNSRLVKL